MTDFETRLTVAASLEPGQTFRVDSGRWMVAEVVLFGTVSVWAPTRQQLVRVNCEQDQVVEVVETSPFTRQVLPSSYVQFKCPSCRCSVNPLDHIPASDDCREAAIERSRSQSDWNE